MSFTLWLAQGFGSGRIPFAPGTFGSLAGLLWFALLVSAQNIWIFAGGVLLSIGASVWSAAEAEKILGEKDPSSVVIDEIIAIPLCFVSWMVIYFLQEQRWPGAEHFFGAETWLRSAAIFGAFRFFDIAKPWPVRSSQSLPGGWGVTVDDLLAAVYVNIVYIAAHYFLA